MRCEDRNVRMKTLKINIGCGYKKIEGFINIDKNSLCKPDIVADINKALPFNDNSISEVNMEYVLSYIVDIDNLFKELYRVCQNGAKIVLMVPHYSFGFVDPYHRRGFSLEFLNFVNTYNNVKFWVKKVQMRWMKMPRNLILKGLNEIFSSLANANQKFCERIWCYWGGL